MKRIQTALWLVLGGLTLLWLLADPRLWTETDVFALRAALIGYTGVLAIGTMSVAMIFALRSAHLEPVLGGLDMAYRCAQKQRHHCCMHVVLLRQWRG